MKRVLFGVLCLAVCASLSAQSLAGKRFVEPTVVDLNVDATQLFREASAPRALVATENPDTAFIFAVAGSTAASGGTFCRSEVVLVNNSSSFAQNVALFYFPSGGG